jgi:hypothetical protein
MPSRIFIALFGLLALLPGLQMMTNIVPVTKVEENRTLALWPNLAMPLARIPRAANEWFNDHFGLRPLLIRLKTQVDYSVFRTSDRVLVGRDGWLFYRSTVNVEEPLVESLLTPGKQAEIVTGMRRFTEALEKAGIRSFLVINMMSDRFYGDKLPASAAHRRAVPRIDELVDKLRALPSISYIDSMLILRGEMQQRQVFHFTDFHWNDPGAFPVAKAVADDVSRANGLPKSVWTHPLEIERLRNSGGIAMFMPLFVPPTEMAMMVKPTFTPPPGTVNSFNVGVFEHVTTAPPAAGFLPPAVFIGDSFLDGMFRSGLQSRFSGSARARWKPGLKLSDIVSQMPGDVRWFIIQFIEINQSALDAFADAGDISKAVELLAQRRSLP